MPFFNQGNQLYWDLEALSHEVCVDLEDQRSVLERARQQDRQMLYVFLRLYPERFRQLMRGYQRWRHRSGQQVRNQAHKQTLLQGGYGILGRSDGVVP